MLLHEPEKLPNRSRWYLRAERIWHPTGAEEISGDMLLNIRHLRREWHYGDRIRAHIPANGAKEQRQSWRLQLCHLFIATGIYAIGFLETDEKIELVERAEPISRRCGKPASEIRRYIQNYFTPESGA